MSNTFDIQSLPGTGKVTVFRVRGRLDAHAGVVLLARCTEVKAGGGHLVLNFAEVPFIASSGIGALLALVEEFRQENLQIRIAAASPPVGSVIRLLNLQEFLVMHGTEGEAVADLEAA